MLSGSDASLNPISCFKYNTKKYPGSEQQLVRNAAGQPLLPCIAAQLSTEARRGKLLQDCFITYPVEACM
jgi:hypothetical protein